MNSKLFLIRALYKKMQAFRELVAKRL